ncbi:ABC transporter permease [Patulibacter sp. SYSU D01012]|uniref:ABC transporter permease n=1 Tax=Patulibacter sp. SYSU D01012 TaxID=2817381 RepID=UPI001B309C41
MSTTDVAADIERIKAAGGKRIPGPGAYVGSLRRMANLTWTLGFLEFRLKFFGAILGYLWQLMRPAMLFGVYFVLFTEIVPVSKDVKYFAPLLLFGIMMYQFFGDATGSAVRAVPAAEGLVRKIHFPRIVIPVSVVVTALLNLAVNLIAVLVFIGISRVPLRWSWLEFFPMLALLVVFILGLALLLSALFVRFRDVAPIWEVFSLALFYGTPILYPIDTVDSRVLQQIVMCNPLAVVQQQMRHSIFDPSAATAVEAIGGWTMMLIPIGITVFVFVLGAWTYSRIAPHVAEEL